MTPKNAFRIRNSVWLGLGLCALAHVQVAHAVEWKSTSDYVWYGAGNVKEANIGTGSGATILDIKGSYNGATIGRSESMTVGKGPKIPLTAVAKVSPASLGMALARFAGKVLPVVAVGVATVQLMNDIKVIMRECQGTPGNCFFEKVRIEGTSGFTWYIGNLGPGSPVSICQAHLAAQTRNNYTYTFTGVSGDDDSGRMCEAMERWFENTPQPYKIPMRKGEPVATNSETERQLTRDELAQKIARESGWPDPKNLGNILAEAIRSGESVDVGTPTVTGPASSTSPPVTKTTTNSQGQSITTTTNTTNNYTYAGNTITNSPTTVTTTVNNNTGEKTEETETTDDKRTECEKNPESLTCATTDVPDGEIPKSTKTVTYSEDGFLSGGGSCPADKFASIHGVSTKVWDWQQACGYISGPIRAVVLVLAALSAAFILIPGKGGNGP